MAQNGEPETNYHAMAAEELHWRGDQQIVHQDCPLELLHRDIVNTRNQVNVVNEEVVSQNMLLDEIGTRMDHMGVDVERGVEAAEVVSKTKRHICRLYAIVASLVVVEILLSVFSVKMLPK